MAKVTEKKKGGKKNEKDVSDQQNIKIKIKS